MTQRIAVVTGGLGGLGLAICQALANAGRKVIAADLPASPERLDEFRARTASLDIETAVVDVADFDACAAFVHEVETRHGTLDILVNNAGITRDGMLHKMSYEQWSEVIRVNMDSAFNMTRPVIEGMRDRSWGRIINISSINGQKGQMGQTNYSAAKAGLIGFTKALALENAKKGVTVNVICPGYIDTEMVAAVPENVLAQIVAGIPVGRLGRGEEIADMVSFLAGERAGFVTGATLTLNGGQYMA